MSAMSRAQRPIVAYLVASHERPEQVVRLVRTLRREAPQSFVLIHHDYTKSDLPADVFADDPDVAILADWVPVTWAEFSQVELVLRAIDRLLRDGRPFEYLTLLSGADYPLRPLPAFEDALQTSGDGTIAYEESSALLDRYVLAWHRLPAALEGSTSEALFTRLAGRFNGRQPVLRFAHGRIGCRIGWPSARAPFGPALRPYKGTTWWSIARSCVEYVHGFVQRERAFVDWYRRRTFMADESFFQTILYNANRFRLRNDDGRFVRWEGPAAASPATLDTHDLSAALASGKFFARKFDVRADPAVLDRLDTLVRSQ